MPVCRSLWLNWVLCSFTKLKPNCWQSCTPFWSLWGGIFFQKHSCFWPNFVPCGFKMEILVSLLPVRAILQAVHAMHVVPSSCSNWVFLMFWVFLPFPSNISLIPVRSPPKTIYLSNPKTLVIAAWFYFNRVT